MLGSSEHTSGNIQECGSHSGRASFAWYCVNTRNGWMKQCIRNIERQGFKTFYPMFRVPYVTPPPGRKAKPRFRPLFPNYLFVSFDIHLDHWQPLVSTYGVKRLFRYGSGLPLRLPEAGLALIESQHEDPDAPLKRAVLLPRPVVEDLAGRIVEVVGGAFDKHRPLCKWSDEERVRLVISLLGYDHEVTMLRTDVKLV